VSRDQLHKTRPGRNRALCKSGRRTMTIFMQIAPMRSATILWDLADHMTQGYDGALDSPTGRACERFPAVWGFCFRRPRHTSNETPANSRRHRCSARWPRVPACAGWVLLLSRIASRGGLAVRPRAFIGSANDGLQGSNRGSLAGAFSARRSPSFGSEVETFTERHAGSQALHRRGHAGPERIMVGEPIQSSRLPT